MSFSSEEEHSDDFHGVVRFFKVILEQNIADKRLMLPMRFSRQYGGFLEGKATLLDTYGKKWEMDISKKGSNESFWFQNGWEEFSESYSLAHGDFVVFEYTSSCYDDDDQNDSLEFSVIVFDGETQMEKETSNLKTASTVGVDMFMSNSNSPCFKHEVTPSYFRAKLMPIPQEFFESFLGGVDDTMGWIKLGYGGKLWDVQIGHHGPGLRYRRIEFADWKRFVEENSVREGDVCVFELIDDRELLLLQVHIFRGGN
ncbi:unnamed protein product [Linum tenue]|uniref:TF-B3 domain-containing protein n=1 Tax=Linum tenue TaxID=586396 RepID=A0AAV0PQT6_9ROSI|nr:unnamed protein product [Linum tenue]